MPFTTFENPSKKKITIHESSCRDIGQGGGLAHNPERYATHATYAEAAQHIRQIGRKLHDCAHCKPSPD